MKAYGLEGVIVADTRLSSVDGMRGELTLVGLSVAEAAALGFEKLVAKLWGRKPELGPARVRISERVATLPLAKQLPMDAVRFAVASLPSESSDEEIVAAIAVATAAVYRMSRGLEPIAPQPHLSHAHDFLSMLGMQPTPEEVNALDLYFCTVVDHGMNASTFTARVIASTDSDSVSAVTGAIGALKGRLHGGAPGPVLDMLDAIGSASQASNWLRAKVDKGERVMGIGHRVYKVRDPRARVLEDAVALLGRGGRLDLAKAVEETAVTLLSELKNRPLHANVEFYTAILLEALSIPRELFTATFACSRSVGWCAHINEQKRHGRLIRPKANYVSPAAVE